MVIVYDVTQEADLIGRLESKLGDQSRSSSLGPLAVSPAPSASSAHDSSTDYLTQSQGGSEGVIVSGVTGEGGEEVDVEQWEEGSVEGVNLLLEDLQASSNSEEESSDAGGTIE